MVGFNAKRREIVASYFGLSLFLAVVSGCAPQVITISNIITTVKAVRFLLEVSRKLSNENAYAINVSYKELGTFLSQKNFSTERVEQMEQRYNYLSRGSSGLRSKINQTNSAADELFSLLQTRADQNSTPELKDKMVSDIRDKREIFKEKMKVAEDVISSIEKSVQKYNDILGYVQVASGIDQIDRYISDVDKVIVEAQGLNHEIQVALKENQTIVASFEAYQ